MVSGTSPDGEVVEAAESPRTFACRTDHTSWIPVVWRECGCR
jgi:hypothetical protein